MPLISTGISRRLKLFTPSSLDAQDLNSTLACSSKNHLTFLRSIGHQPNDAGRGHIFLPATTGLNESNSRRGCMSGVLDG
jgi:hypothetical protein